VTRARHVATPSVVLRHHHYPLTPAVEPTGPTMPRCATVTTSSPMPHPLLWHVDHGRRRARCTHTAVDRAIGAARPGPDEYSSPSMRSRSAIAICRLSTATGRAHCPLSGAMRLPGVWSTTATWTLPSRSVQRSWCISFAIAAPAAPVDVATRCRAEPPSLSTISPRSAMPPAHPWHTGCALPPLPAMCSCIAHRSCPCPSSHPISPASWPVGSSPGRGSAQHRTGGQR
jgi:hypothetical protein